MADGTFINWVNSELSAASTPLVGTERFAATQGGGNVYLTPNDLLAFHPGYASGTYYPCLPGTAGSSAAVVADTPYAYAFFVPKTVTIQELAVRIGTGVAGNMKFAIYDNVGGRPDTKLHDGNLTPSTAGSSSNAVTTFASNPTLTPGWYHVATIFSANPSIVGNGTADQTLTFFTGLVASSPSASSSTCGFTGTGTTYAGGFLSTFGTATVTAGIVPRVVFKTA